MQTYGLLRVCFVVPCLFGKRALRGILHFCKWGASHWGRPLECEAFGLFDSGPQSAPREWCLQSLDNGSYISLEVVHKCPCWGVDWSYLL